MVLEEPTVKKGRKDIVSAVGGSSRQVALGRPPRGPTSKQLSSQAAA